MQFYNSFACNRELSKRNLRMYVWLTKIVPWINEEETGVSFVDLKNA